MTVLIKAKGYINNNERGANKTLLSYSQLAALTSADAVDEELNADPTRYYNALDGDSHIGTIDGNNYIVDGQGNKTIWVQSGGTLTDGNYAFYFNDGVWEAEVQVPSLMTYEEIIALDLNPALTELNSYPTEYYSYLNSSGYIVPDDGYGLYNVIGDPTRSGSKAWSFTGKRYSNTNKEGGHVYRYNGTFISDGEN